MNPGQEKFLNFILERVEESQAEAVKEFMEQNFKKQLEGSFGQNDIAATKEFLEDKVKPEHLEEVNSVMQQFAGNFMR